MILAFLACIATEDDSAIPVIEQRVHTNCCQGHMDNNKLKLSIQGSKRNLIDEDDTNDIGVGAEYRFGIVESRSAQGESCLEQSVYGCWTGRRSGTPYVAPSGQSITNKCHIVATIIESDEQTTSIEETFDYSLSLASISNQPDLSSSTTHFRVRAQKSMSFASHIFGRCGNGECWAWGVDPSYFDDQTATTLLDSKTYRAMSQIFSYLNNPQSDTTYRCFLITILR